MNQMYAVKLDGMYFVRFGDMAPHLCSEVSAAALFNLQGARQVIDRLSEMGLIGSLEEQ